MTYNGSAKNRETRRRKEVSTPSAERRKKKEKEETPTTFDLVPCPYVEHQHFYDTELLCDIQECKSCPMQFNYFQENFKMALRVVNLIEQKEKLSVD